MSTTLVPRMAPACQRIRHPSTPGRSGADPWSENSSSHSSLFFGAAGLLAVFFIDRVKVRRFELGTEPDMHGRFRERPAEAFNSNARGPTRLRTGSANSSAH